MIFKVEITSPLQVGICYILPCPQIMKRNNQIIKMNNEIYQLGMSSSKCLLFLFDISF